MKQLKFLSFLIPFVFIAQNKETISIGKENNTFIHPTIGGVFEGEIRLEKLGTLEGIQVNDTLKVVEYVIEFPSGSSYKSIKVLSNLIPDSILLDLRKSCLNELIFITSIRAKNNSNKIYAMPSMALIPKLNEDE